GHAGAEHHRLEAPAERVDDGHGRHRGRVARVAAVAAAERGADGGGAAAVEVGVEVDDGHVGLHRGAVDVDHGGRVVQHHRGVAPGDGGTGVGAAQVLDAVLAELEAGRIGGAGGHHPGDAEGQGGQ